MRSGTFYGHCKTTLKYLGGKFFTLLLAFVDRFPMSSITIILCSEVKAYSLKSLNIGLVGT